ncbi:MAG TPA: hypothetical protein ENN10_02235 [Actinobacteria bacterium]|nr:hypothetical protein [Actinomycetota bacterium]
MRTATDERVEQYRRVLGLGPAATLADVRRHYRREIRRWHPDVAGGDAERARLLNEAEEYLTRHPDEIRPRTGEPARPTAQTRATTTATASRPSPRPAAARTEPAASPARNVSAVEVPARPGPLAGTTASRVVQFVVLAYVALLVFAILGYFFTTILPLLVTNVFPIVFG